MLTLSLNIDTLIFVHSRKPNGGYVAKVKHVVAQVLDYWDAPPGELAKGTQGKVLGKFRQIEFARQAKPQMREAANNKSIGRIGIFLEGKFLEVL